LHCFGNRNGLCRNIACEKLNDEAFIAEQEAKVVALAQMGFRAGVALAKEAFRCDNISDD